MRYAVLSAVVIAFAAWYAHRHRAAIYHRCRYDRARCHAAPTRIHRVWVAVRRLASVRIHITIGTGARTAS